MTRKNYSMEDLANDGYYQDVEQKEKLIKVLEEFSEIQIVSYLRQIRRLPISIMELTNDNRDYCTNKIITEGCILRTEHDLEFLYPLYEITEIISNPYDIASVGQQIRCPYNNKTKILTFISDKNRGKYANVEVKEVRPKKSYLEYLKGIDREILRQDYKEYYDQVIKDRK